MKKSNLKTILASFIDEVWSRGDCSNLSQYLFSDYEIRNDPGDPWDGKTINHAEFRKRLAYSRNAFPDLRFDLDEMIEEDEAVAVRWHMSGTYRGDLPQLPATGKKFLIMGMTFYYFQDGKLCGHTQAFDQLGFLSQIGVLSLNTGA